MLTRISYYAYNIHSLFDGTLNNVKHFVLMADSSMNDTYTLSDMFKQDDVQDFVEAMVKEVQDHEDREYWELFARNRMPAGSKTILAVWSFKQKRYPDGQILKHKARLCAHGGMQRWGIDFWETYAPVVNWISMRLLLILAIIHGLDTKSIDFVLAFPLAKLETNVFVELPYGFNYGRKGQYVLKIKKHLYGLKSAAATWFNFLCQELKAEGFVQSEVDQCIFLRDDCILLVYVDDVIAISHDIKIIDELILNLKQNYDLEDDGSLIKYLGVDITTHSDGKSNNI